MSGFVGLLHTDGRHVEAAVLDRMSRAIAHRGCDRSGAWVSGPIGLAHRLLFTTPESLDEHQPVSDEASGCRLVWDGRLDNRTELCRDLEAEGARLGKGTDAELVLAAYLCWGRQTVPKLCGDFAFALWDGRSRTLLCARDRLGLKPLHYAWQGTTVLFGSEVRPILAALSQMPEPDDEMVLAFLLREFREDDHGRTLFRGIQRLPPGNILEVHNGATQVTRYWAIEPTRETRYRRCEDYVEKFRELFFEAVRCRISSEHPVGLFLSGGLDSSGMLVAARSAGFDRHLLCPAIEAFTTFTDLPESDERRFAQMVADGTSTPLHHVYAENREPLTDLDEAVWHVESPIVSAGGESGEGLAKAMLSRGCRVVLTGVGGDQLIDEVGYLADLLARLRLVRFTTESRAFASWYGGGARFFAEMALMMLVPRWAKFWGKRITRGVPPPWINRATADELNLRERIRAPRQPVRFPSHLQADAHHELTNAYHVLKLEVDERSAASFGMDVRYPFLDSRLVEYVLSIPWHQRTRDGERKALLRHGVAGLMPESVRLRRGKGDWSGSSERALAALCRRDPPEPLRDISGRMDRYVRRKEVERLVARYLAGRTDLSNDLWYLITTDRWLARFWGGD